MSSRFLLVLCLFVVSCESSITLREAGGRHDLLIGTATNQGDLISDATYKRLEQEQYSLTTAENSCKATADR